MGKKWNTEHGPGEKMLRLFALLLFTPERFSLNALADMLDCSKQTVLRLIDQIESIGWAKVQRGESGRKALFWIERPGNLPRIALNPEGLEQLVLCRNFLEHLLPPSSRLPMDAALQQATAYVPEADAVNIATAGSLGGAFTKGRIDYSEAQGFLHTLMLAAKERTVCEVIYKASALKEPRTFDFAPQRIMAGRDSIYVIGWEVPDKGNVALLYADPLFLLAHRIREATITRRTWKDLPDASCSPGTPGAFGIMRGEPFTVVVRITTPEAVTYVAERIWSEDQKLEFLEDDSLILTMTAQSPLEVMSWVLSLGSAAELLQPDWLQKDIHAEIAAIAGKTFHSKK
jgi:predicted DNA-binding transcriptional regulator YafY